MKGHLLTTPFVRPLVATSLAVALTVVACAAPTPSEEALVSPAALASPATAVPMPPAPTGPPSPAPTAPTAPTRPNKLQWFSPTPVVSESPEPPVVHPAADQPPEPTIVDVKDTVKYATVGLNVRGGPSTDFPVVSGLRKGQEVTVTATNGNGSWSRVGSDRWVSSTYVAASKPTAPAADKPAPAEAKPAVSELHVKDHTAYATTGLNVRSGPGTNYKVVSSLRPDAKVTVYATNEGGSWSRIGDGQWVSSTYVTTTKPGSQSSTPAPKEPSEPTQRTKPASVSKEVFCMSVPSSYSTGSSVKSVLTAMNKERARNGVGALSWSGSLASASASWSKTLASRDDSSPNVFEIMDVLAHNPNRPTGAENVSGIYRSNGLSQASALANMHGNLMHSYGHCLNTMNPSLKRAGVGVASANGGDSWYVTVNFGF